MVRRLIGTAVLAAALVAAACSGSPGGRQAAGGAPPPGPTTGAPTTAPPTISDEARIYAAVLNRQRSRAAPGMRRITYLAGSFCLGMIEIDRRGRCAAGTIPASLRRELLQLVPGLRIAEHPPLPAAFGRPGSWTVVRLGTADVRGSTARVAVDQTCGGLCGQGETVVLGRVHGIWRVTGATGPAWIS